MSHFVRCWFTNRYESFYIAKSLITFRKRANRTHYDQYDSFQAKTRPIDMMMMLRTVAYARLMMVVDEDG